MEFGTLQKVNTRLPFIRLFRSMLSRSKLVRLFFTLVLACAINAGTSCGQERFDFESVTPSWRRSESDCVIQSGTWKQRRVNDSNAQNRFERIEFTHGIGTRAFVVHDVTPALIISELKPSVRFRSPKSGAQLYVRVVLPNTPAPSGIGPMTVLIRGPVYQLAGKWETMSFDDLDLAELLQQEIWVLRATQGEHVSKKGAYVDKIAIDTYVEPGRTLVDIDDLTLQGVVAAKSISVAEDRSISDPNVVKTSAIDQDTGKPKALVTREGTVLLAKGKPLFPKVIEHNGEKFDFLKAIGFNVVQLKRTATFEQLREASELGIWLICPPPSSIGLQPIPFEFDRVLAWDVGKDLEGRNVPMVERTVREIRESDSRFGRLVVGHAAAEWSQVARITDILSAGQEPIGTSFIASQYSDWIAQRRNSIGNEKPVWADIQTELSSALENQIGLLTDQPPPLPVEPQQIKFLVYEAIVGGARGLRFRSRNRLDGIDPVTMLRLLTLRWINAELNQLEPWIVGGALMGQLPESPLHPNLEVTAINTNRSRLLIIQRPTHHEQYVAGDQPPATITFRDSASPFSDNAYLVGQSGLVTLANTRGVTGTEIKIDNCPFTAAVVMTQDPVVVNRLTQSYRPTANETILTMHTQITQQWLAIQQLIDAQMGKMGRGSVIVSGAHNEAVNSLRNAMAMTEQGSLQAAENFLHAADMKLATARRELVTEPLGMFQSKTSAPLTTHCSLVPLHWELVAKLGTSRLNPNGLVGGDFENLDLMLNSGWQNHQLDNQQVVTRVEQNEDAAFDGRYGLKLMITPRDPQQAIGAIETPPLIIESPPVPVRGGQLVRIHGWVKIPQLIQGSMDGLKITDSLAGAAMAERIPVTNGWQEFTLYRSAGTRGVVSVKFELTGVGTAILDEVTIRSIDLPSMRPRQAKRR